MPVSELRFNLPGSTAAPSPRVDDPSSKRSSFFHRGRHSRNNSSFSVHQDAVVEDTRGPVDRMDLSLGQEFAGGGFGAFGGAAQGGFSTPPKPAAGGQMWAMRK